MMVASSLLWVVAKQPFPSRIHGLTHTWREAFFCPVFHRFSNVSPSLPASFDWEFSYCCTTIMAEKHTHCSTLLLPYHSTALNKLHTHALDDSKNRFSRVSQFCPSQPHFHTEELLQLSMQQICAFVALLLQALPFFLSPSGGYHAQIPSERLNSQTND